MADWLPKYYCNYCQDHITDVRIKCAECQDFDLCLQCFSFGAEIGPHKHGHRYHLIDSCSFPIFKSNEHWKAREELLLLDSIEHFGYGNWEDPVRALEEQYTVEKIKKHFEDYYIQGNIGKLTWNKESDFIAKDHTSLKNGPLSPVTVPQLPSCASPDTLKTELGYMPKRDDFEREYENDAESLVSSLVISNDDEDIDTVLKMAHIDMYIRLLKERQRRKNIVLNHSLVNEFYNSTCKQKTPTKKKSSRDEKELRDKFQPFAQFQSASDNETYFSNLKKEKELKTRIKELVRYRKNGLTKLKDCNEYESARYKREKRKEYLKKKSGSNAMSPQKLSTVVKKLEGGKSQECSHGEKNEENDSDGPSRKVENGPNHAITGCSRLLSSREKKLCSSLGLKPSYYIKFKTILLKDQHLMKGNLSRIPSPSGIAKSHRNKILGFFIQSGWISAF